MKLLNGWVRRAAMVACAGVMTASLTNLAHAQESVIRKNITERLPDFPKIDEVTRTGISGLYEVRVGTDIFYTDEQGNHLIEGQIIDTRSKVNLTEVRVAKLSAIDFGSLPLKDAIVWKQGNGSRKVAVFSDPNCGYCKRLERDLQQIKDVTVYTFLMSMLGPDSVEKSRNIWCAKDNTQIWLDWMLLGASPGRTTGQCDTTALQRNMALGKKYKVNGTPTLVFEDGKRVPGAMALDQIEKQLVISKTKG